MADEKQTLPHHPLFADSWARMRKWWSVRCGIVGIIILAGLPELSNQFPNIAPSLIAWFPKHGAQWVPCAGAALAIVARIVDQAYVASKIRNLFGIKNDGQS